jgi:hypothetical protein
MNLEENSKDTNPSNKNFKNKQIVEFQTNCFIFPNFTVESNELFKYCHLKISLTSQGFQHLKAIFKSSQFIDFPPHSAKRKQDEDEK